MTPMYKQDLAAIHDAGFSDYADGCAPGVIAELTGREHVLEIGCGSGSLTKHLLQAGIPVDPTDASPGMLEVAARRLPDVGFRLLTLPDDPIPAIDAIVSVGHALNYLTSAGDIERSLHRMCEALQTGGLLLIDICDLEYGLTRQEEKTHTWIEEDWVLVTKTSLPGPDHLVRDMTMFVRNEDGTWHRDDEVHHNVLVDVEKLTSTLDDRFAVSIGNSFGNYELPAGMRVIRVERRPG